MDEEKITIDRDLLDVNFSNVKIKIPITMKQTIELLVKLGFHWTTSDYIRDAINGKIEHDVQIMGSLFDENAMIKNAGLLASMDTKKLAIIKDIITLFKEQSREWKKAASNFERKNKKRVKGQKNHDTI